MDCICGHTLAEHLAHCGGRVDCDKCPYPSYCRTFEGVNSGPYTISSLFTLRNGRY